MEAIIKGNRIGMSYDCEVVESVARLNREKKTNLSLYAYYEDIDIADILKEIKIEDVGDIIICKSDRYFWMLEEAKIARVSREYLERYIRVKIEVVYSSASGSSSETLIKRNSALKKLLGE